VATKNILLKLSVKNYIIIMGVASVLAVAVAVLVGQGLVKSIIYQSKVQSAKSTANAQLDKNLVAAPTLVKNYKALADTGKLLAEALPTDGDVPGFVASLENIAGYSQAKLKAVSPSQNASVSLGSVSADIPAPQSVTVSASFGCDYISLLKLLDSLEKSARPIRVSSMQISGGGSDLAVQLELTTYYQPKSVLPLRTEVVK
jgi:Tfp pilus assembly protein PilO